MTLFDIRNGFASGGNRIEEVQHMAPNGRGNMAFEIFLVPVLWILIQLHDHILVNGLFITSPGDEVVAVDTRLQCAFFSI